VIGHLDRSSSAYTGSVVSALAEEMSDQLIGVYLYGSGLLGDFIPGRSDVDLLAVCTERLAEERARSIAEAVLAVPRPTQVELDINMVALEAVAPPSEESRHELRILTHYGIAEPRGDEEERSLIMIAFFAHSRSYGLSLYGPPARKVIQPIPHKLLCRQMLHTATVDGLHYYRVLNACRSWRYLEEGLLCSKGEAARWALERGAPEELIKTCLTWREFGEGPDPEPGAVDSFVAGVATMLARAC
jgi:streptomycin 3"-adenylyltransferase